MFKPSIDTFKYRQVIFFVSFLILFSGCTKLVEVKDPVTGTNPTVVFSSDATAIAALTGIYIKYSQDGIRSGVTSLSLFPSLSGDELQLANGVNDLIYLSYSHNSLNASDIGADFWGPLYSTIFIANSALEGLASSNSLTEEVKQQLIGEALFIRAFSYFYLVNLYGDVPLALTSDYKKNGSAPRVDKSLVYQQIIQDLKDAQGFLNTSYLDASLQVSEERTRPNKFAATALLARAYLFSGDYQNAEIQASSVIDENALYDTTSLSQVFLKNSKEAIWQLQPVDEFVTNTSDARLFILPDEGPGPVYPIYLRTSLINSFSIGDKRKTEWVGNIIVDGQPYYYPFKYKNNEFMSPVTEYTMVIRLAEMYLIRAEASAQLQKLDEAIADLNVIRIRAGLPEFNADNQSEILDDILKQRQAELFTEWGHRWLDLKRSQTINDVLGTLKGADWQSDDQLYPIPQTELDRNPSIKGHQNPNY